MDARTSLMHFIDAVVSGNEQEEKQAFSTYTELKTREMVGLKQATAPFYTEVKEGFDVDVIKLDGNVVLVKGKKVGLVKYSGNNDEKLEFISNDGDVTVIKNGDIDELNKTLRSKFLGEQ